MKKIFIVVIFSLISCGNVFANGKILKSGFITKSASVNEGMNISDPKNKIIIIYNHGQNKNDKGIKNECIWVNQIRNKASLVDVEINNKKIMVYNFCTNDLAGDMSPKKYWKFKEPYEGIHKLDKRIKKNLELVDKFVEIGVPRKQIIISGHSCGGLLTLMLLAAHPEKVGGGISYMQACYGKLSKQYKVKKVGSEEALAKFAKKYPGGAELRQRQIDNIKKSNDVLDEIRILSKSITVIVGHPLSYNNKNYNWIKHLYLFIVLIFPIIITLIYSKNFIFKRYFF